MNFNTEACSYLFKNEFFSVFQLYHEMYIIAQQVRYSKTIRIKNTMRKVFLDCTSFYKVYSSVDCDV